MISSPVADSLRTAFARPAAMTVSAWADTHRLMLDHEAVEKGRWRTDRAAYLRGIMDAMDHPAIREMTIIKAERLGVTEAMFNGLYYWIDRRPANVLWVYPTTDVAEHVLTKRVIPTIKGMEAIARHLGVSPRLIKIHEIEFDRMLVKSVGSNSEAKLEASGWARLIIDEFDRCDPDVLAKARGRVATYPDHKIIRLGTPSDEDKGIHAEYLRSDQREFHVPCPICGEFHVRRFEHVKWIPGANNDRWEADKDRVLAGAWFRCPACDGAIHGYQNAWQLQRGLWVPKDCTIRREKELGVGRVMMRDGGGEREWFEGATGSHAGWWPRGLLQPFQPNPYGYVASEIVAAKGRPHREWINRRLGEPWQVRGSRKIETSDLRVLCRMIEQGGYRMGTAPCSGHDLTGGVLALTLAADVQENRIVVEVLGWSAGGQEAYLIDYAELPRVLKDNLATLGPFLERRWPLVNQKTGEVVAELPIVTAVVDSGHFTTEVYEFTFPRTSRRVYASKGYEHLNVGGSAESHTWSRVGELKAIPLLRIGTHRIKGDIADALLVSVRSEKQQSAKGMDGDQHRPERPREEWTRGGVHARCRFPENTPEEYFRQLTSEWLVPARAGSNKEAWKLRPGRTDNHVLDCRVGNIAAARAMGVENLGPAYVRSLLAAGSAARAVDPPAQTNAGQRPIAEREQPVRSAWRTRP